MKPKPESAPQLQFLLPDLATMLDERQPLHRLARRIGWAQFESAFATLVIPKRASAAWRRRPASSSHWRVRSDASHFLVFRRSTAVVISTVGGGQKWRSFNHDMPPGPLLLRVDHG